MYLCLLDLSLFLCIQMLYIYTLYPIGYPSDDISILVIPSFSLTTPFYVLWLSMVLGIFSPHDCTLRLFRGVTMCRWATRAPSECQRNSLTIKSLFENSFQIVINIHLNHFPMISHVCTKSIKYSQPGHILNLTHYALSIKSSRHVHDTSDRSKKLVGFDLVLFQTLLES